MHFSEARSVPAEGSVTAESNEDLRLVEHDYYDEGDTEGVEGTVKNVGDTTYSYVEVHLSPVGEKYERERFEVDSQEAIDSLAPGETWAFDVALDGAFEFSEYDIWVTGRKSG